MGERKKIIITGGGTGGHVFPGIALARELVKHPEVDVLYVGKKEGPEAGWVPSAGFEFEGIAVSGMPRTLSPKLFTFFTDLVKGFFAASALVDCHHPAAVFSTGGYVSVPVSLAASLKGVPVGLFEPNVVPGLAAKVLAFFAKKIFTGFEGTVGNFSRKKTSHTGIPVREEILNADKQEARKSFALKPDLPTLLMLGGSQGAHSLNRHMTDVVKFLGEGQHSVQVIMMTGWNDYRETVDQLASCPLRVVLRPFLSNIHEAYAAADLVVARAGAMTCAEIMGRGLPALFIPYPHASGHQEANARALEKGGAAMVILEKELGDSRLTSMVLELLKDETRLKAMGEKAKALSKSYAAQTIAEEILNMAVSK